MWSPALKNRKIMAVLLAIAGPLKEAVFQLGIDEVTIGRLASSPLCVDSKTASTVPRAAF
jgi:hypothetical protein